jgi:hypothetical protein
MKVKDILSDPSQWTKCTMARNEDGRPCDPLDERAVQFCLRGAIIRSYPNWEERKRAYDAVLRLIQTDWPNDSIEYWYCLAGALEECYGGDDLRAAVGAVLAQIPGHYSDIESWNDEPGRTFEEVRQVIERAGV